MKLPTTLLICLATGLFGTGEGTLEEAVPKVQLDIYYESLCPDSVRFIINQLKPTFAELGKYLDVGFYPYGKATTTSAPVSSWTFTCQHGPDECTGNKKQACILDKVSSDDAELRVKLISCMMEYKSQLSKCLANELSLTTFMEIVECSFDDQGSQLLKKMGDATMALDPPMNYVPWLVINKVHNGSIQEAEKNLRSYLCSNYLQHVQECQAM